jgi:hypothetical protein
VNGPLSPEELEAQQNYWNTPGLTSDPGQPQDAPAAASYYGPPAPPPPRPDGVTTRDVPVMSVNDLPPAPTDVNALPDAPPERKMQSFDRESGGPAPSPSPAPSGGGGPSTGGLVNDKVRSIRNEAEWKRTEASLEGDQKDITARAMAADAEQRRRDAEQAASEAAHAKEIFDEHEAASQRIADAIAETRIDGSKAYSDGGSAAMAVIGGLLGGLYQGLNKMSSNPFIDQMNRVIDREITVQEAELKNRKDMLADRRNGLAQMRAIFKDDQLAKAEYKKALLDSAMQAAKAKAAEYDSPIIESRVEQAIAPMERNIADLKLEELRKQAAAAQAAAAAKRAAEEKQWERLKWAAELELKDRQVAAEEKKAGAEAGKKTHEDVKHIGDKLQEIEKDTPGAVDIRNLSARKGSDGLIPGTGRAARAREAGAPPIGSVPQDLMMPLNPAYAAGRLATRYFAGLSDEEQDTRNGLMRLHQAARHDVTGAAFSKEEKADIARGQLGLLTAKEETALVDRMSARLEERRNLIRQENPEAAAILDENLKALKKSDAKKKLDIR